MHRSSWMLLAVFCMGVLSTAHAQVKDSSPRPNPISSITVLGVSRVDINRASKEELLKLPITPQFADLLIKNRPYRTTRELVSKSVFPQATYDGVKDFIVVRPATPKASPVKK